MTRILSVLPHAGGNVAPTLELLGELTDRGAQVRVLGHRQLAAGVADAGIDFQAFVHARPWSATVASPGVRSLLGYLPLASDRGVGTDIAAAARAWRADVVIVDCMLPGGLRAARRTGAAVVTVMHTLSGYWDDQWSWRSPMGQWLRLTRTEPTMTGLRPDLALLTTMPELDVFASHARLNRLAIVQTGPLVGRAPQTRGGDVDGPVLISLSTISYPGQHQVLQRLVDAVGGLELPAVVTTGPAIDPGSITAPSGVDVRRFVPHEEVLPTARLVIGHGGHGTTMRAIAHGVPVLVVPMSRYADHALVGRAVAATGAGTVSKHAPVETLSAVIRTLLDDPDSRSSALRLSALLAERDARRAAADEIDDLLRRRQHLRTG